MSTEDKVADEQTGQPPEKLADEQAGQPPEKVADEQAGQPPEKVADEQAGQPPEKVADEQAGQPPEKLADQLPTLNIGKTRVDILGTVHISRLSREHVAELLAGDDYDMVAVELCESRHKAIVDPDAITRIDLGKAIRERKLGAMTALVALSAYQERLADHLGVELGGEMKEAVHTSHERGIKLELIDRDIGVTLKRVYRSVPWWRRMMLLSGLLVSLFSRRRLSEVHAEEMQQGDVLTGMFQELQALDPRLYKALITERDRYMGACIISHICRQKPARMLVVVGMGHVRGLADVLLDYLRGKIDDPRGEATELNKTPAGSKWIKFVPWIVVGVILAGFAAGFRHNTALGLELVFAWILINGGLSSLGALLAGGHPLTILTAFLAAPLTSINPTVGAGMVTAAAEVYMRQPTVADFKNLRKDTMHWSGWRHNRVARTLLVFFLSSIGSAFGTYFGGFYIYDRL